MDDEKKIVNSLYHAILLSSTSITYAYLFKRMFRFKIDALDKFELTEILKVGGILSLSSYTIDMLIARGITPKDIMK